MWVRAGARHGEEVGIVPLNLYDVATAGLLSDSFIGAGTRTCSPLHGW